MTSTQKHHWVSPLSFLCPQRREWGCPSSGAGLTMELRPASPPLKTERVWLGPSSALSADTGLDRMWPVVSTALSLVDKSLYLSEPYGLHLEIVQRACGLPARRPEAESLGQLDWNPYLLWDGTSALSYCVSWNPKADVCVYMYINTSYRHIHSI